MTLPMFLPPGLADRSTRPVASGESARPGGPSLTVETVNVYVRNRRLRALRRRLRKTRAHIIGGQECQRLGLVKGYVRFSAPAGIDRDAGEVAIYVRADLARRVIEFSVHKAHGDAGKPGGVARDRYVVRLVIAWPGQPIGVYCTHANAGVMGDGHGPLLDRPASKHNEILTQLLLDLIVRDEIEHRAKPITLADWNAKPTNTGPGTPAWLHDQADMTYVPFGIDGIGFATDTFKLQGKGEVPAPGSNHDLGMCRLVMRQVP